MPSAPVPFSNVPLPVAVPSIAHKLLVVVVAVVVPPAAAPSIAAVSPLRSHPLWKNALPMSSDSAPYTAKSYLTRANTPHATVRDVQQLVYSTVEQQNVVECKGNIAVAW
jgi:hypothetical protein